MRELAGIDQLIRERETQVSRQTDEERMHELLAELRNLQRRKEALPFLIRGARARILRERAEECRALRDAAEEAHNLAVAELEDAKRNFDEAAAVLERANERLKEAERQREATMSALASETRELVSIESDARRIEQGQPTERQWFSDEV